MNRIAKAVIFFISFLIMTALWPPLGIWTLAIVFGSVLLFFFGVLCVWLFLQVLPILAFMVGGTVAYDRAKHNQAVRKLAKGTVNGSTHQ